jgi:aspartyl/glutamyl-tRNA(Asn/Gln) amidotransferase C subunit
MSSDTPSITKHELEHLAKLARIELDPSEEEKLIKDLDNILDHFKELQALDTSTVVPMTGGTALRNVFREDGAGDSGGTANDTDGRENTNCGAGVEAFPESKNGFLKIPPVFE